MMMLPEINSAGYMVAVAPSPTSARIPTIRYC